MPTPLSFEAKNLLRLLDGGEWHDLEETRRKLAATVGPGKALRRYEERVMKREVREGPRRSMEQLTEGEKIASGQRILAGTAINSMKRNFVEIKDTENGPAIRLREDMPTVLGFRPNGDDADPVEDLTDEPDVDTDEEETEENESEPAEEAVIAGEAITEAPQTPTPGVVASSAPPVSCGICGMYVANQMQHDEWHRLQEERVVDLAIKATPKSAGDPQEAVAFFSEAQVKALIEEVVGAELDAFQKGMQKFLIGRFAAVEAIIEGVERDRPRWKQRPTKY